MGHAYPGDSAAAPLITPISITALDDTDPNSAGTFNTPYQKLTDAMERARRSIHSSVRCLWSGFTGAVGANDAYGNDQWHVHWSGATAPSISGPGSAFNQPSLYMVTPSNGDTFYASCGEGAGLFVPTAGLHACFDAYVGFAAVGANNINVNFGFANLPFSAHFKGAIVRKNSAENTFQCLTDDGTTTTTTNSGVTASTAGFHHIRIEWFGSGFSGGPKVLFYIDGNLVATHTTNVYTGTSAISANVTSTAVVGTANGLKLGRTYAEWNPTATS